MKVLDSVHTDGRWTLGQEDVYFFTAPDKQGHSDIRLYEFSTGNIRKILTIERGISEQIAVSPDSRTILYTQLDEAGSDLMLVGEFPVTAVRRSGDRGVVRNAAFLFR